MQVLSSCHCTGRKAITGPRRDKQPFTLALIPGVYLEISTCLTFNLWEETEVPEKTNLRCMKRTRKLHTEKLKPSIVQL